ncbi:hypothetical protein ACFLT9_00270 [Acidobacteriota bacterium]
MKSRIFDLKKTVLFALLILLACLFYPQGQIEQTYSQLLDLEAYGLSSASEIRVGSVKMSVKQDEKKISMRVNSFSEREKEKEIEPEFGRIPRFTGNTYVVTEFESGLRNNLNSYFNTYTKTPATAYLSYFRDTEGFKCLGLKYSHSPDGYCGMWMHLIDRQPPLKEQFFFDSTPFSHLSLWVKGEYGGERILLKVSDKKSRSKDTSFEIGELSQFLPSKEITQEWQQAVIPLDSITSKINQKEVASLTFQAQSGESTVFFRTLALSRNKASLPRLPKSQNMEMTKRSIENSFWVWKTTSILGNSGEIQNFLTFVEDQGFKHVFLQIPGDAGDSKIDLGIGIRTQQLRPLIAALNKRGVKVYALDGSKEYALRENHQTVLKIMRKVILYNQQSRPEERFFGFHWDIEPYILKGFQGRKQSRILQDYIDIHTKMAELSHQSGMEIGASLPFWYDSGKLVDVKFKGKKRNVLEAMLELMDHIAIMAYRTTAFGPSGTIAVSELELSLAEYYGKDVFVGLETTALPDEYSFEFSGRPKTGLPPSDSSRNILVVLNELKGDMAYVVPPNEMDRFKAQLKSRKISPKEILYWRLSRPTRVEADWLTFNKLGADRLFSVLKQTKNELLKFPSFAGFAIHYYSSFRELLGNKPYSLKDY